jgi:hypothetical protein
MRKHLVSAPGIAVRRGQSAVLMPIELLVKVARTDYADASLRSCSEHEFGEPGAAGIHAAARRPGAPSAVTSDPVRWRARAQPKLRSEFIPSTPEPATETQPSRNSTSPNSLL